MGDDTRADLWLRDYITTTLTSEHLSAFLAFLEESFAADVPELASDAELERDLRSAIRGQFGAFLEASGPLADGRLRRRCPRRPTRWHAQWHSGDWNCGCSRGSTTPATARCWASRRR